MITQIYAIQTLEDALACIEVGTDYIGFLPPQHRPEGLMRDEITETETFRILEATKGKAVRVCLCAADDPQAFIDMAVKFKPDALHIASHSFCTDAAFFTAFRQAAPDVKIMQAVGVTGPEAVDFAKAVAPYADYLLLDTPGIGQKVGVGASGNTHDRAIDRMIVESVSIPVIIAGGLGPDNVAEAIRATHPFGVDSMTKTNIAMPQGSDINPLLKDIDKVRKFCEEAKRA